jgi:hypothetical protein
MADDTGFAAIPSEPRSVTDEANLTAIDDSRDEVLSGKVATAVDGAHLRLHRRL